VTHDFSVFVINETTGLVVNSVTSSVLPGNPIALTPEIPCTGGATGYSFNYTSPGDFVFGGGDAALIQGQDDDFGILINGFNSGSPIFNIAGDSLGSLPMGGVATLSSLSLTVTEVLPPVPVPASGLLLGGRFWGASRCGAGRCASANQRVHAWGQDPP
jgi:hypothetical protein